MSYCLKLELYFRETYFFHKAHRQFIFMVLYAKHTMDIGSSCTIVDN